MIIVDLNQVIYKSFFASVGKHTNIKADIIPLRNMVLNNLRLISKKFRHEYGEMVLASDSKANWRKEYYPEYKAIRKRERDKSDIDWAGLYTSIDALKVELAENFPYNLIEIEGCEADDVIAILTKNCDPPIMIISGDKDFRQLQKYKDVYQYDPIDGKFITEPSPDEFLYDHIIKGERGDSIPNIICADDYFVSDTPSVRLTQKRKDALVGIENRPNDKYYQNWVRNKTLIDMDCIPQVYHKMVMDAYKSGPQVADRSRIMQYIMNNRLGNLLEHINDF